MKTGASVNRYHSKQDYGTPIVFLDAVKRRFGSIDVDLAATKENRKATIFVSPEEDSLSDLVNWDAFVDFVVGQKLPTLAFLNPPFSTIEPWARKCAYTEALHILLLVPASVGSNWWRKYVHAVAGRIMFLSPRLSFDGKNPYPKDLALIEYNFPHSELLAMHTPLYECWSWK